MRVVAVAARAFRLYAIVLAVASALQSDVNAAIKWLQDAHETGYRDYGFLERIPMLKQQLGGDPRFLEIIDRMRGDVAAQRERARARGLLELTGLLTPQQ